MKRLTQERESRGWSRTELGSRARVHPAAVGKAENGREVPYPPTMQRLADALGFKDDPAALLEEVAS